MIWVMKKFSTMIDCPHLKCDACTCLENPLSPNEYKDLITWLQKDIPLISERFTGSRWKAKLGIRKEGAEIKIGLFARGSHNIVDISSCPLHHSSINELILEIKKLLKMYSVSVYSDKTKRGELKYLQIFIQRDTGKGQIVFVVNQEILSKEFFSFLKELKKHPLIHSICININQEKGNAIFGKNWQQVFGPSFLKQKINELDFYFHPASFSQAHLILFEKLVQQIQKEISPKQKVVEFFAGIGAIGLNLLRDADIVMIENNPYSKISYDETIKHISNSNHRYLCLDATKAIDLIDDSNVVIIDPPRKGMGDLMVEKLCQSNNKKLIYVSCNLKSFKKEAEILMQNGWNMEKIESYLFFPGTDRIELFGIFVKGSG